MPTQRFHNLPEDKRRRIIDAALSEFAANGIDAAQVAGVVRGAGIPRGSFYQYFADMDDLFGHVFGELTAAKLASLKDVLDLAGKVPFVDYVEMTFEAGIRFAKSHRHVEAFARQVVSSTNPAVVKQLRAATRMGVEHYRPLIDQDKAKGLIRESVDAELLARLVLTVLLEAGTAAVSGESGAERDYRPLVELLFDILRHGIKPEKGDG